MKLYLLVFFIFLSIFSYSNANKNPFIDGQKDDPPVKRNNADVVLHIKKTATPIKIDGLISEDEWADAEKADNFIRVTPVDSGMPQSPTEVMMTYDDKAFYLGVTMFDTIPGKRIFESFRRDFGFQNNDNFIVFIDPYLDQTNGYAFGTSASGAEWDGTESNGSSVNLNWDCKWYSKTTQYADRWVSEMRIPFRSVRFKSGTDKWYINFSRNDLKTNEKSAWAPIPRQFTTSNLAYTGILQWDEPLPESKMMFSFIPYVFGSMAKDFEARTNTSYRKDIGFDAKLGLSTSMNLDLTYNPDFSQAEVDQQVTNLDRFELFFPEKRQFFLENSDLFSGYGSSGITPFFSRRIGLDAPVLGGMRLSGKLGTNWRLGLLDMQTERTGEQLSRNFMVASIQRQLFSRSNIGFILVNKEYMDEPGAQNFNRIAGVDYNLASSNNAWIGKLFYHRSFSPENPGKQYAQGASLSYNTRQVHASIAQASVGGNYNAEAGYVRRVGYNLIKPEFGLLWIPNKQVVSHGPTASANYYFDKNNKQLDHEVSLKYKIEFKDRSVFDVGMKNSYIRLNRDYDPIHPIHNSSQPVLENGTEYSTNVAFIDYYSDARKMVSFSASATKGGFYSGDISTVKGYVTCRFQPYLNMTLNFSYTDLDLPSPFERSRFWLLGPKFDLTMSEKVFFSSFVQYNQQTENLNVNMRLQWRYQPVSDLFIVYTDNYYTSDWGPRNRALVLKLSYWFN